MLRLLNNNYSRVFPAVHVESVLWKDHEGCNLLLLKAEPASVSLPTVRTGSAAAPGSSLKLGLPPTGVTT